MGQSFTWILLGVFTGAQLLLVVMSLLIANAYDERGLRVHAVAVALGVAAVHLQRGPHAALAGPALLVLMALSAWHLRHLTSHVGSLKQAARWMDAAAGVLAVLAAADAALDGPLLLATGAAVLLALDAVVVSRAWSQSLPWALWVVAGQGALLLAGLWIALPHPADAQGLPLAALLTFWAMALYLASVWRSRMFGERRWRQAAERLQDPLTGLATSLVLVQRLQSARSLMRRYGHPSALLLVHVDELPRIARELGAQKAEAAALEAGLRLRGALGPADIAARVGPWRFAILSEGSSAQEAAANLATRLLTAGLREELHAVEGAFLHFRVVLAELPTTEASGPVLLRQLGERLDTDAGRGRERRIRIMGLDDAPSTRPVALTIT